jgi:hypothetical protein
MNPHIGPCDGCDQTCETARYRLTYADTGAVELVMYCRECAILAQDEEWSPEILRCRLDGAA